uniref:Uncharacterized protein n=1 Tax=Timema poppense TaxID=170557 RepID=A0A7R9D8P4_TIMPO|nr:unnamed protein product [Timema poppensis]
MVADNCPRVSEVNTVVNAVGCGQLPECVLVSKCHKALAYLYEKYPFLYNTLRSSPKDDLANRLYKDRMRTTYQIDYCKMNEFPSTEYDNLVRAAGVGDTIQDAWTNTLPGCPCRPLMRNNIASRRGIISKTTSPKGISISKMADSGKHKFEAIPWRSEYQDSISKLGGRIIREGLHCQSKK